MRKKLIIFFMAAMVMTVGAGCSSGDDDTAQQSTTASTAAQTTASAQTTAAAQQNVIGDAKAKQIALDRVSGAKESDLTKFHLETDDGRQVYEGEIRYNDKEYDFEIDAVSGDVVNWEEDSIYDD
ncbi:PepSY domain-containing protein [Zhenpiania hominis]|uniref:PepSY domain-containing protein n=1 Tax=Zhenpiania hominis TaxID=2763644 RepID=UPI0039F5C518